MTFRWNEEKEVLLKTTRKISFTEVVYAINNGGLLNTIPHHNRDNQVIFVVRIASYVYAVPEGNNSYFLKTIYPNRDLTKEYKNV
jgi:hypothetical protein